MEKSHRPLPSINVLIKGAWSDFSSRIGAIAEWSFFGFLIQLIFMGVLAVVAALGIGATIGFSIFSPETEASGDILSRILPGVITFAVITGILLTLYNTLWNVGYAFIAMNRKPERLSSLLRRSWGAFWPIIPTLILSALVQTGGSILIIPGIYLNLVFMFLLFVTLEEGLRGRAALAYCVSLLRDRWWSTLWRVFAPGVVLISGWLMVTAAFQSFNYLPTPANVWGLLLHWFFLIVLSLLLPGLLMCYIYRLYNALRDGAHRVSSPSTWYTVAAVAGVFVSLLVGVMLIWMTHASFAWFNEAAVLEGGLQQPHVDSSNMNNVRIFSMFNWGGHINIGE